MATKKEVNYGWQHNFIVWLATQLNVPILTEHDLRYQRDSAYSRGIQLGIHQCSTRIKKKLEKAQQLRAVGKTEQAVRCEEAAHQLKCVETDLKYHAKLAKNI